MSSRSDGGGSNRSGALATLLLASPIDVTSAARRSSIKASRFPPQAVHARAQPATRPLLQRRIRIALLRAWAEPSAKTPTRAAPSPYLSRKRNSILSYAKCSKTGAYAAQTAHKRTSTVQTRAAPSSLFRALTPRRTTQAAAKSAAPTAPVDGTTAVVSAIRVAMGSVAEGAPPDAAIPYV